MLAVTFAHSCSRKSLGAIPRHVRQYSLISELCIALVAATRSPLHFRLGALFLRFINTGSSCLSLLFWQPCPGYESR